MIGLCLPHPRFSDDFASHGTTDGILLHLMQVRHRFSVSWWSFASMCSSSGCCLLTRRKSHQRTHVLAQRLLAWQTPQELVFVLLRHSQCLVSQLVRQLDPHPRHLHRCCHQATRPGRPLVKGCVMSSFLRLRSSCEHNCKSRQCLLVEPEFASDGLQLLVWNRFMCFSLSKRALAW